MIAMRVPAPASTAEETETSIADTIYMYIPPLTGMTWPVM